MFNAHCANQRRAKNNSAASCFEMRSNFAEAGAKRRTPTVPSISELCLTKSPEASCKGRKGRAPSTEKMPELARQMFSRAVARQHQVLHGPGNRERMTSVSRVNLRRAFSACDGLAAGDSRSAVASQHRRSGRIVAVSHIRRLDAQGRELPSRHQHL